MVEATKARVAPVSSAMLYGRGVFTTVAVYDGEPFHWPDHWERLLAGAERLNINSQGLTRKGVMEALTKLIAVNQVKDGRARVILLARTGRDFWRTGPAGGRQTDLLIMTGEPQKVRPSGITLAVSPYRANSSSPLAGTKTLNYLDRVLSWEEAQSREFDEAVVLNERGEVVSATMSNIFWIKDGTIHTPNASTGAYLGVTREVVIGLAEKLLVPVLEGIYELADLTEADEIFLTSASLGVGIVTTFDFRQYGVCEGNVSLALRDAFVKLTQQRSS